MELKGRKKSYIEIEKIIKAQNGDPFLVYHIQQETGYNYVTIKKVLTSMVTFEKLKFDDVSKLYIEVIQ